jgi:uncharacterized RDD family membrane protein YckC
MTSEAIDFYIDRVLRELPPDMPRREHIALELRGHIAERVAAGKSVDDVLRQLGDPVTLAESYLAEVPLVSGSFWRRVAAKVIDFSVILVGCVAAALLIWLMVQSVPIFFAFPFGVLTATVVFGVYLIAAEARDGQTFGKRVMDLRVVRESGGRITVGQAVVRNLPMFLEVFLIDALFALFTEKSQRAFEWLAKTRVVVAGRSGSPRVEADPHVSPASERPPRPA